MGGRRLLAHIAVTALVVGRARAVEEHEYCVVGAGPAGLQLGYFLETAGRDYVVLEASPGPGSFFETFPRHRNLISINKRFTGSANPEFNLRHDWNSLLAHPGDDRPLLFAPFDKAYFPKADSLVAYLQHYARTAGIKVRYNTTVEEVARAPPAAPMAGAPPQPPSGFLLRVGPASIGCDVVVVATGLHKPRQINADPDGVIEYYDQAPADPDNYTNQEVLVIGKGNAGFETAQAVYGRAARVHLVSRSRLKMSWETHYVGHIRGVNNEILDSYQLKSMDTIGYLVDATKLRFRRDPETNLIRVSERKPSGEWEPSDDFSQVDRVVACTGWQFDDGFFTADTAPRMQTDRYPLMTAAFESATVPGLHFAGTLQHGRDWPRSSGGFIHGFRYLVRALHRELEARRHGTPWPSTAMPLGSTLELTRRLLVRVNQMSGPYQMFGTLTDVLLLPGRANASSPAAAATAGRTGLYLEEVPADLVPAVVRRLRPSGPARFITVGLEYGRGFSGPGKDVFNPDNVRPPDWGHVDGPGANNAFLHPVFRLHRLAADAGPSWLETASPEAIRSALANASAAGAAAAPATNADADVADGLDAERADVIAAAVAAGMPLQVLEDAVCPPDPERGRSVCFESSAVAAHHMLESLRIEFWEEDANVLPLGKWLARHLRGLQPLSERQATRIADAVEASHRRTGARARRGPSGRPAGRAPSDL